MLSNIGRAAIKRIGGSHLPTNRFLASVWQLQRVEGQQNGEFTLRAPSARRLYATATKDTETKTATVKKPATKKAPAAKKSATKESTTKAAKKPVKKVAKQVKAKAKPKKKVAKKVVLTDLQKSRKQLKSLRVTALISETPKRKPDTAYRVLFAKNATGCHDATESSKLSADMYKKSSTAELERLDRIAAENKAANEIIYKQWVESHTPEEIRQANIARLHIRRLTNKTAAPRLIKDDRAVKQISGALAFFMKDRFKSGDFAGIQTNQAFKDIVTEYKQLSPEQLKGYKDAHAADVERYVQEYKTVYKHDAPLTRKVPAQA
ncbi:hypothetical protein NHQ30_006591 [Ciborinia camelliae]|nr:hypothetical protein NHQ30_006591 [Ciborinia camelliae]